MFVVPMDAEGITVRPLRQVSGEAHFNEVFFDDVRLPPGSEVGPVDGGWGVAMTTLMFERVAIGLGGEGFGWRADRFAKALAVDPAAVRDREVRHRFGEIAAEFLALRFLGYRTLTGLQQGRIPGPEAALAKVTTIRAAIAAGDLICRRARARGAGRRALRRAGLRHAGPQVRGRHRGDPALDGRRAGARPAARAAARQGRCRSASCGRASARRWRRELRPLRRAAVPARRRARRARPRGDRRGRPRGARRRRAARPVAAGRRGRLAGPAGLRGARRRRPRRDRGDARLRRARPRAGLGAAARAPAGDVAALPAAGRHEALADGVAARGVRRARARRTGAPSRARAWSARARPCSTAAR